MSIGRVCSIHNEWCADGTCRWCEPLPAAPALAANNAPNMQQIQKAMDDCWAQMGRLNQQAQEQAIYAPTEPSGFPMTGWYTVGE